MSLCVVLDSGPLGMISNPRASAINLQCRQWVDTLLADDVLVYVPEIADYEIRRELLRASKVAGLQRLDAVNAQLRYLPLTTVMMRQAALLWAQMRQQGQPTAADVAIDGDVILAAQALSLATSDNTVVVATTNVGHLARMAPARLWHDIS
jgi:predicted nucleic acid-binding protein